MSVTNKATDDWGNKIYDLPYALYLYYLNNDLDNDGTNSSVLSNMTGLVSVNYTPFLEPEDIELWQIPYDYERFDKINSDVPALTHACDVFRIASVEQGSKFIAQFSPYNETGKTIGGKRNWKNEGKLYNSPYYQLEINDGINPPLLLRPEFCPPIADLGVKTSISERCSYGLFVQGYKGDTHGFVEAMVSGDGAELPSTTSQWANWVATSKNQTNQNVQNAIAQSKLGEQYAVDSGNLSLKTGAISSIGGVIGSALSLNFGGALMNGVQGVGQYYQNKMNIENAKAQGSLDRQNVIQSAMAQAKDMRTAPNTLLSQGANPIYGIRNNDRRLRLYRYGLTPEYAQRIGDYFALFGYKQNKMMKVDTRSRNYYNYVKMLQCNIKSNSIPNNYLEELQSIFEKGVRIWHVDRSNFKEVGNYEYDNYEV